MTVSIVPGQRPVVLWLHARPIRRHHYLTVGCWSQEGLTAPTLWRARNCMIPRLVPGGRRLTLAERVISTPRRYCLMVPSWLQEAPTAPAFWRARNYMILPPACG